MKGVGHGSAVPVRVEVLGPLRLVVAGHAVDVPGPKRRALLALLAVAGGRAVAVDDLLAALWPGELPGSARGTLQSHVSRLRGHLGAAAPRLVGLGGAYRLALGAGESDVAGARDLLEAARSANAAEARRLLLGARSLWRGEALVEFPDVPPLTAVAVSLAELRRSIDEALVVATLAAAEIPAAVSLARELAAAEPHSETAALLLVRALHAGGRTADALRAAYDFRRRLAADTGLDPTAALGELEAELAASSAPRAGGIAPSPDRLRGRDSELAALRRLLADERLVTVVGPGGVGKTRLAIEVAGGHEPATSVLLAPVTDGAAIPYVVAGALGVQVVHGDALHTSAALLAAGPHLLLLDNCEHLLDDVRSVASFLLDECPELRVLATSREPLGLAAEQRLRVAPLSVARPQSLDDVARSPAVAVFCDRARRVRPEFSPGPSELELVVDIVRRLDGMPLAIGLAAARLTSLGLADLHARIDHALDLLGDDRDGTLRTTIAWSYRLLPEHEQRLFRALSAFPDGVDLAAAEAVAAALGLGPAATRSLAHLADASIVEVAMSEASVSGPAGGMANPTTARYRMLDTVRSFASAELVSEGERDEATERFLTWALGLAAWIDRTVDTDEEAKADAALRRELGNLRAAWALVRSTGRTDDAIRLVTGLHEAAGWRDVTEVWGWGADLAGEPVVRGHAGATGVFAMGADSAWARGQFDRADELARSGLELGGPEAWRCVAVRALVALSRGDLDAALLLGTFAGEQATRPEQSFGIAALAAAYQGDLALATRLNDRLGTVARSPTLGAFRSYVSGEIEALAGRTDLARAHYGRSIDLARGVGSTFVEGIASVGLLSAYQRAGRILEALGGYRELIDYWERTGGWVQQWTTLRNLARLLEACGEAPTAALLRAAAASAPDAPPAAGDERPPEGAVAPSRGRALEAARAAIERVLGRAGEVGASAGDPAAGPVRRSSNGTALADQGCQRPGLPGVHG